MEEKDFLNLSNYKIEYLGHINCINAVAKKEVTFEMVKSMSEQDLLDANTHNSYPKSLDKGLTSS